VATERRVITSEEVLTELGSEMSKNEAFVDQLRQDPAATLDGLGIEVPANVSVRLEQGADGQCRLVAYRAADSELTDDELRKVAGGLEAPQYTRVAASQSFTLTGRLVSSAGTIIIAYLAVGA
jgi:hypothetical protein